MRLSRGDRVLSAANYVVLSLILISVLYPMIYIVSSSLSSSLAVISGRVWLWPVEFGLKGYTAVFKHHQVMTGYLNSFIYTILGTAINLVMTILAAYPLSRRDFCGRNLFMGLFTFTMLFGGGLIATYLLIRDLNLLNTRWVMVLPNALGVWNMIVARTFFQTNIPDELVEASELDGCNDLETIWHVVLPLSKPIMAVMALFYAVGHWNAYFQALIYLNNEKLYPLQIILRSILILQQIDMEMITDVQEIMAREGMKDLLQFSLIVVASAPVLILYPFVQKYFIRGLLLGSLKG